MTRAGRFDKAPPVPIIPILKYLTGVDVQLRGGGAWRKCSCPFHEDNHPSAAVSADGLGFRCLGSCGRHGDAIKLLREEENLSYVDALGVAQELTGVESTAGGRGAVTAGGDPLQGLLVG